MKKLGLREQQLALLDLLDYFNSICQNHQITYSLGGGTLIGAVRHQGFIPWDDDLDIYLFRDEYYKLLASWNKIPHKRYDLEPIEDIHAHHCGVVAKIYDKRILVYDHEEKGAPLFLDLFIYDGVPNDEKIIYQFMKKHRNLALRFHSCKKRWKKANPSSFTHKIYEKLSYFFFHKMEQNVQNLLRISPMESSETIALAISEYHHWQKSYMPKEWFSHTVLLDFEGRKLPCMNGYHEHLLAYYGDYLTLPPKEEQIPKHSLYALLLDEDQHESILHKGLHNDLSALPISIQ